MCQSSALWPSERTCWRRKGETLLHRSELGDPVRPGPVVAAAALQSGHSEKENPRRRAAHAPGPKPDPTRDRHLLSLARFLELS